MQSDQSANGRTGKKLIGRKRYDRKYFGRVMSESFLVLVERAANKQVSGIVKGASVRGYTRGPSYSI